ncbi:MAG: hypothetical protein AAFV07_11405 [Bacteroidota bacterium]
MSSLFLRSCCLTLCMLGAALFSWAQPEIQYVQGQLRGSLPYNQRFLIKGSVVQGGSVVSRIQVDIYQEKNRNIKRRFSNRRAQQDRIAFKEAPYTSATWERNADAQGVLPDSFELYVADPLLIATRYKLVFQFFHRYEIGDATTQAMVAQVRNKVLAQARLGKPIRVADVNTALNEVVQTYAVRKEFGRFVNGTDGRPVFLQGIQDTLQLQVAAGEVESTGLRIGNVIVAQLNLERENKNLQTFKEEIDRIQASADYAPTLAYLERNRDDTAGYNQTDILNLKQFASTYAFTRDPFPGILTFLANKNPSGKEFNVVASLAGLVPQLDKSRELIAQSEAQVADLDAKLGKGGLNGMIAEGFVRAGVTEIITMPQDDLNTQQNTGSNSIKIGTAYGVALVGLNLGPNLLGENGAGINGETVTLDMVSYIGAKFFFRPLDKRFANSYFNSAPVSRLSILAGSVIGGQLSHKGFTYGNPIGLKPVVGLSYDFSRFISVELGAVFFDEPAASPFLDRVRLRASPFAGLSIDADAFNRVRDLLSGDAYRQKPANQ